MYKINKDQGKNSISQHQESAFILINNQIEKDV